MIYVPRYALIALYTVLWGSAALVDTLPIPWRFVAKRVRNGENVIVFPEGTRSQTATLGPF